MIAYFDPINKHTKFYREVELAGDGKHRSADCRAKKIRLYKHKLQNANKFFLGRGKTLLLSKNMNWFYEGKKYAKKI